MILKRWLLVLTMGIGLVGCAGPVKNLPTQSIIPTVRCHENDADELFPPIALFHGDERNTEDLRNYSKYLLKRYGDAFSVYQSEVGKRRVTSDCLNGYRKQGIIY